MWIIIYRISGEHQNLEYNYIDALNQGFLEMTECNKKDELIKLFLRNYNYIDQTEDNRNIKIIKVLISDI